MLPQDTGSPRDTSPRSPSLSSDTGDTPDAFRVSLRLPLVDQGFGEGEALVELLAAGRVVCAWSAGTRDNLVVLPAEPEPCGLELESWSTELRVVDGVGELLVPEWPDGARWAPIGPAQQDQDELRVEARYALGLQALASSG